MTGFAFDAAAALRRAREVVPLPTLPTLPTPGTTEGQSVGTVGSVGTPPHPTAAPEVGIDAAHSEADDARLAEIWEAGEVAHAEAEAEPDDGFPYGVSPGGRPVTWTGRVVSLAEWRALTDWQRHGPRSAHWSGATQQWEPELPPDLPDAANTELTTSFDTQEQD